MKNFLNALKEWLSKQAFTTQDHFTGLKEDDRPLEQKQKDFVHEEREFPQASNPFSNPTITQSPYPYENQNSTSSCVPHGVGLALAIERKNDTGQFVRLAPAFPYRLRSNYPGEGSSPFQMFERYSKFGAPLYTTLPTPQYEQELNKLILTQQMYIEAEIFKGKEYWVITRFNDIQTLANVAQQGHGVPITIFAMYDEYSIQTPVIKYPNLTWAQAEIRHEVCILPNSGFIKDGVRYVVIQDSAWFGGWKYHYLSEDFIKARCYYAAYWDTVSVIGQGPKPKYTFTKVLRYGSVGPEVKKMQELLISEGLLPSDLATGNYYGRTLAGVNAFQNKYAKEILLPLGLDAPTGVWGSASIAMANKLCN